MSDRQMVIAADVHDALTQQFRQMVESNDQASPVIFYVTDREAGIAMIEGDVVKALSSMTGQPLRGGVFCSEVWIEHTSPGSGVESLDSAVVTVSFDRVGFDLQLVPFTRSGDSVSWFEPSRPELADVVFTDVLAALQELVS